jgi:hypothetical protein
MTPRRKANYNPHSDQPHVSYRRLTWAPLRHNYKSIVAGDDSTFGCGCGKATPEPSSAQDHAFSSVSSFAFHRQLSGTPRTTSAGSSRPLASRCSLLTHPGALARPRSARTSRRSAGPRLRRPRTIDCAPLFFLPSRFSHDFPSRAIGGCIMTWWIITWLALQLPVATFVGTAIWLMGDGNK